MPRNYDKDTVYCTSWSDDDEELLREFLKDAKANNHSRFPGVYQKIVIGKYYKALREGRILPEGMNMQMFFSMQAAQTPVAALATSYHTPVAAQTQMSSVELAALEAVPDVVEANTNPDDMDDEMDFFLNQDDDD